MKQIVVELTEEQVKNLPNVPYGSIASKIILDAVKKGKELNSYTWELMQVCEKQANLIEKLGAHTKAYTDICEALQGRLEELEHETENLEADLQDGVRGYGMNRKCFEVRVKKELLRDIICFVTQALEEAKEGGKE